MCELNDFQKYLINVLVPNFFMPIAVALAGSLIIYVLNSLWKKIIQKNDPPSTKAKMLFRSLRTYNRRKRLSFDSLNPKIPINFLVYENVEKSLPVETSLPVTDIYENGENMLLLGKAGSGKSRLLEELTLKLIEDELKKGEKAEDIRLPVFLPLQQWAEKKKPFKVWLAQYLKQELNDREVKRFISSWMQEGKFILLMDGLDEMSVEDSQKCLDTIRKLRHVASSLTIILSCEIDRYEVLERGRHFLEMGEKKVVVEKLKPAQVLDYLTQKNESDLIHFLFHEKEGEQLRKIIDSPRLLELLVNCYTSKDLQYLKQHLSDINSEASFWSEYVKLCSGVKRYSGQSVKHWLIKLERYMGSSPVFSFQLDNLPRKQKILYLSSTWLFLLVVTALPVLFVVLGGLPFWQLLFAPTIIAGFYGYLFKAILTGLYMAVFYILTILFLPLSLASSKGRTRWQKWLEVLRALARIFLPVILLSAVLVIWVWISGIHIWLALVTVWFIGWVLWYISYQLRIFSPFQKSANPVMASWLALRDLMIARQIEGFLSIEKLSPKPFPLRAQVPSMLIGIISGSVIWCAGMLIWQVNLLPAAIYVGTSIWLDCRLGTSIRGLLLRFCFCQAGILPREAEFLDAMTPDLLIKHENIYKFTNGGALRNYFRQAPRE